MAIVVPYESLDTLPVLCDLSEALTDRGYDVDIIGPASAADAGQPTFASRHIRVLDAQGFLRPEPSATGAVGFSPRVDAGRPLIDACRRAAMRFATSLEPLKPAAAFRWRGLEHAHYELVIGVDPEGLTQAEALARRYGAEHGYYSLELLPSEDLTTWAERLLKWREARTSRRAAFVIVQDPSRGQVLVDDNGIDPARLVFAPNAPRGTARRAPSRWWHERYDLMADQRVLLHAGSVSTWTGIDSLIEASRGLPDGWVLAVHSNQRSYDAGRLERLRIRASAGKVIFSDGVVPRDQYRALVDGADAGVAFYLPGPGRWTMKNLTTLGLASGKVSYYLWCGLPVIVNTATSLGGLVASERVGVSIGSAAELGAAVGTVSDTYEHLSRNATDYFNAKLDYRLGSARITDRIDSVLRGGAVGGGQTRHSFASRWW